MASNFGQGYSSLYIKEELEQSLPVQLNYKETIVEGETNIVDENSFRYDPLNYPLKSTQQLNVDWSKFENHTFFSSAEVKVNEAFNTIINGFPFDGTKKEMEAFCDKLTGFEKYVYDNFPTWSGALHFKSSQKNYISVEDKSGFLYPEISRNSSGTTIINPSDIEKSFTIEAQIFLPTVTNGPQVIMQKNASSTEGFTLFLESSISTTTVNATFCVSSGSVRNKVTTALDKGKFNHICVTLNKQDQAEDFLQFYVDEDLKAMSDSNISFYKLNIDNQPLLIGSGSAFYSENTLVTPTATLSGTIDELRIFHSTRTPQQQTLYATRGIYQSPDLKLYYRFNEPPPPLSLYSDSDAINSMILDSSGNSLHASIVNFTGSLRINAETDELNPIKNERLDFKKVLFPASLDVREYNEKLLEEAKLYDLNNPNGIIKLIPPHYLLEGAAEEGFSDIEGNAGNAYGGSGMPGQGEKGSTQVILSFLYIWSKFFDEIKLFLDAFGTIKNINYETDMYDTVPDNFLQDMIKNSGFYLPTFFNHSSIKQYVDGEDIDANNAILDVSLKKLQANIMRRVLMALPDISRSKGTLHSIKSFLRSVGIDPDNSLKIREYGGSTTKTLTNSRESRNEFGALINFTTSSLVTTPFLTGSRIEPGYPEPAGAFVYSNDQRVGTTNSSDGLLTSGSWTTSAVFKVPKNANAGSISLLRMFSTGSNSYSKPGLIFNLIATQKEDKVPSKIKLYGRPSHQNTAPTLSMYLNLPDDGIFDGNKWNISFGRKRSDEITGALHTSSSYYLRASKTGEGEDSIYYLTSSFFGYNQYDILQLKSSNYNASGTFFAMGNQKDSSLPTFSLFGHLNGTSIDPEARTLNFNGLISNFRFWSKSMDENEWKEQVKNYKSLGTNDPYANYNYTKTPSGSFNQIRIDSLAKQPEAYSATDGKITFLDFSQRNMHLTGSGFGSKSKVLVGDSFSYSTLSPSFDEASTNEKIRIRSYSDPRLLDENPWAVATPSYLKNGLFATEEPQDDTRLSIEFSLVDALDRDIVNMFSTLEILGDAIGAPELAFSVDYPDLEKLRDVYFNRLSEKMNFKKFLEFYRWFDMSISTFVHQLIPSRTKFYGTNYVIESHMLERHKYQYKYEENYLGDAKTQYDNQVTNYINSMRKI